MIRDITLKLTREMLSTELAKGKKELFGHLGTHFDVMDKTFPLEYTERKGIVFDISGIADRDISIEDIVAERIERDMFVGFYSGFAEKEGYGTFRYRKEHPQLSYELIDLLIDRGISIIGIDFAGVRRGAEHSPADQKCADRGVFIVENLCDMETLCGAAELTVSTYPMHLEGLSGIPCRVIARSSELV